MPLQTSLPSSAKAARRLDPSSSSSSWPSSHPLPLPDAGHIAHLRVSLAHIPHDLHPAPPSLSPASANRASARVLEVEKQVRDAFTGARGDPSNPRWAHVGGAARLTCTRNRRHPGSYISVSTPTTDFVGKRADGRCWLLAKTEEEWLDWEAGGLHWKQPPEGLARKGKKEPVKKGIISAAREKVKRWQEEVARSSSSDPPDLPASSSQSGPALAKTQATILFKTVKRSSQLTAASGKKYVDPAPEGTPSSTPTSRIAGHRHAGTKIRPRDKPRAAAPSAFPAAMDALPQSSHPMPPHIQDLSSDSHPRPSFPSHNLVRSTPPPSSLTRHLLPAGLSSPPNTPDIKSRPQLQAATRALPFNPSPDGRLPSLPPISSLPIATSTGAGTSSPLTRGVKRVRPLSPSHNEEDELRTSSVPPAAKRARTDNRPAETIENAGAVGVEADMEILPSSGPGARNATPPRSSSVPRSSSSRRSPLRPGIAAADSSATRIRVGAALREIDAEAETAALHRARTPEGQTLPTLAELLRASAKKSARRGSASKKPASARKNGAGAAARAKRRRSGVDAPREAAVPSSSPLPPFTQESALFAPADASIHGLGMFSGPRESTPVPHYAPVTHNSPPAAWNRDSADMVDSHDKADHDMFSQKGAPREVPPAFTQHPDLFAPIDASIPGLHTDSGVELDLFLTPKPPSPAPPEQPPAPDADALPPSSPLPTFTQESDRFAPADASFNCAPLPGAHADFLGVGMSASSLPTFGSFTLRSGSGDPFKPGSAGLAPRSGWALGAAAFSGIPQSSQLSGDVNREVDDLSAFMEQDVDLNGWLRER